MTIIAEFKEKLIRCETLADLDALRVEYFGKNGIITGMLKRLGQLDPEERKAEGARINAMRDDLQGLLEDKKARLEELELKNKIAAETVDITLPSPAASFGTHHLITETIREISRYFETYGFTVETGPDIDSEEHNFDALNIPSHHPARQSHDTFYINKESKLLLRTHTSTIQSRTFKNQKPPLRILAPGRVYRADYDATHLPMFHQIEGFVVEEGIDLRHLKGCLIDFCRYFFNVDDIKARFRPSFFPFTEPSFEMDIWRDQGWLEVLGCGMIHPNVLRHAGLDPDIHQGFAFGMGVERFAMLKYGVTDIRDMVSGDLRFAQNYGITATQAG